MVAGRVWMFMSETWSPTASADSWREFEGPQGAPGADLWIPGWSWPASAWAPPTPQSGLSQGPTSWLRPPPTSPGPQARSFTGGLGQLVVPGKAKAETPPLSASPPQQRPPEPGTGESAGTSRAATPLPSLRVDAEAGGSGTRTPPLSRRKAVDMRLRMELGAPEEMGQVRPGF